MGAVKRNTLSVLFIIKKAKLLKNGEAPICMRITVNKRVAEVMIKRSIPVDLWNQKKECSKGKDRVAIELNHYINTVRAKVLQIHRELEIDNKPITADIIKDCFYGRDKVQRSLLEVYAEHNEKCRALIGKEYTESTVTKFDTSINRLKEYIRSCYHRDDIMDHPEKLWSYAYIFLSLNKKYDILFTPLSCALKALILALKDSAEALVALRSKKFNIVL